MRKRVREGGGERGRKIGKDGKGREKKGEGWSRKDNNECGRRWSEDGKIEQRKRVVIKKSRE